MSGRPSAGPRRPRIALVKLSSLGDLVHALPTVHVLRRRFPAAELTWVVERSLAPLLEGHPDLDQILPVDTRGWRRAWRNWPGTVVRGAHGVAARLSRPGFDVALDLQGLLKSGILTLLTRAPVRVGFALRACREPVNVFFTNRRVDVPPEGAHVVEQNLALLAPLGIHPAEVGPPVFVLPRNPCAERAVDRWLEAEGVAPDTPLAVLAPGSGGEGKRWGVEAYCRLGRELAARRGMRVAVAWGPGEEALARSLGDGLRGVVLEPRTTTIPELVALLRRATLAVGGDTGPVHVAAALGVATVGLYGPTRARRNGPCGPRVRAVESASGRMEDIAVAAVVEAAEALLR